MVDECCGSFDYGGDVGKFNFCADIFYKIL